MIFRAYILVVEVTLRIRMRGKNEIYGAKITKLLLLVKLRLCWTHITPNNSNKSKLNHRIINNLKSFRLSNHLKSLKTKRRKNGFVMNLIRLQKSTCRIKRIISCSTIQQMMKI